MRRLIKIIILSSAVLLLIVILVGIASVFYVLVPYPNKKVHEILEENRVQIQSFDGITLVGEIKRNQTDSHHWAVLVHSYRTDHTTMYNFGNFYTANGWHVLYPDNRAHGNSGGHFIGMGYLDRLDLLAWVRYILSMDSDAEIVLHGLSMGASAALMFSGLSDEEVIHVKAIIADSGYASAESYLTGKLYHRYNFPAFPIIDIANVSFKIAAGYFMKDASAVEAVKQSCIPILIIHGSQDQSVSVNDAYLLFAEMKADKVLLIIQGAGHGKCQSVAPEKYWKEVNSFLNNSLCYDISMKKLQDKE